MLRSRARTAVAHQHAAAVDDRARLRVDHQPVVGVGRRRNPAASCLHGDQGRHRRRDALARHGARAARHPGQLDRARCRRHGAVGEEQGDPGRRRSRSTRRLRCAAGRSPTTSPMSSSSWRATPPASSRARPSPPTAAWPAPSTSTAAPSDPRPGLFSWRIGVSRPPHTRNQPAGGDAVADREALGEAEGLELAHVALEHERLEAERCREIRSAHRGSVGDELQHRRGPRSAGARLVELRSPRPNRRDLVVGQIVVLTERHTLVGPVPVQLDAIEVAVAELGELRRATQRRRRTRRASRRSS